MHTLLRVTATDADGRVGACGPCFETAHASRLLPTGAIRLPISGKPEIGGPPQHEGCDLLPPMLEAVDGGEEGMFRWLINRW